MANPMTYNTTNAPKSAVILLSGGLDSAYNLWKAKAEGVDIRLALTFDYGQRAATKEIATAKALTKKLNISHQVIEITWFSSFTKSSLINRDEQVPIDEEVEIDNPAQSTKTAARVWVPNRNGIFLNIAAGFAEGLNADAVIPGFNKEEAATFPDNSQGFQDALENSFRFSTATHTKVFSYSTALNKTEIVKEGKTLNLPFSELWPCYFANEKICGQCESCLRFKRALHENALA